MSLARGTIKKIANGEDVNTGEELYLQILEIEKMPNGRYKIKLNDEVNWMWALVPSSSNSIFENGEAINGSVISVTDHVVNNPNGQKLMILKTWSVLQQACEILGSPAAIPTPKPAAGFGNRGGFGGGNNNQATGGFGGQTRSNNPFGGSSSGPTTGGNSAADYQPVSALSPFQKSFKIKVRVTRKGDIREWNNSRGSGKLFSVDLLDEHGGEIQATCFNDAAEKFFSLFEEGKVYTISKGRIKVANKRYTHIKNDYSIDLNEHSEVNFVGEDTKINSQVYDFKQLSAIADLEDKSYVDAVGVCDHVGEVQNFTSSRTNKELTKRTFRIVDQSGAAVECTLWGQNATALQADEVLNQVVACKAARVSDFNGKSLSVNKMDINPAGVEEAKTLHAWWQAGGSSASFKSLTVSSGGGGRNEPPITLAEMDEKRFGTNPDKPDYFNVVATIVQIPVDMEKRQPWYKAVPEEGPAYKVTEAEDGNGYWCEKLGKSYDTYVPRYIMRAKVADHTGAEWINMYNEISEVIMGQTAKQMETMWDEKNENGFNKVFKDAQHQSWNFRCRARQNEYQGEVSRRVDALSATPIDYVEETKKLSKKLEDLMAK